MLSAKNFRRRVNRAMLTVVVVIMLATVATGIANQETTWRDELVIATAVLLMSAVGWWCAMYSLRSIYKSPLRSHEVVRAELGEIGDGPKAPIKIGGE